MSESYSDPKRRKLVLVWADGSVAVDDPRDHDRTGEPLRAYLFNLYTDVTPEVPSQVLAHCGHCGRLHECRITKRDQHLDADDYFYIMYDVVAMIPSAAQDPNPMGGHAYGSEQLVTVVGLRIDGRA